MHGTGTNMTHQEPGKSCFLKRETGSKLIASSQFQKESKISHCRKHKPKSKSHAKTTSSNLSKKKATDAASSRKGAPLKLQSKTVSVVSSEGDGKDANGDIKQKKLRKRNKKRQKDKVVLDEASRLQRRTRYLLIKMKLEQNLIDAYSAEGWKGQSREKIKPEKELQRARKQILKCKLGLRDAIHQLDLLSSVGSIEDTAIAPDGSIYHEHIFCAKCKLHEAFPDNDIVLCDGTCNCAFHQKCLDPPLDTESIPPGDQGWFCKFCECKMEIIEAMNAHIGTHFPVDSNWQDIFKEEATAPDGGDALLNLEEEWPSDDSEDDDYDPEKRENSCSVSAAGTVNDALDDGSSSTSLSWSSEGKAFPGSGRSELEGFDYKSHSVDSSPHYDESSDADAEVISGRRQRRAVDYKKLYDEMFGKDAPIYEQISEDEDWGPRRKRRREKESDAVSTLMTLYEGEKKCLNSETVEVRQELPPDHKVRRSIFRIPRNAVEKLRQVFAENELPSRTVKENLSKELGLQPEKVSKWFKNARYMALKTRKVSIEFSDDVSLKKLLKAKRKGKKMVKTDAERRLQAFEEEVERLCRAKARLENMKQTLLRLQNDKASRSNKSHIFEESVIYVPVAELKEKP